MNTNACELTNCNGTLLNSVGETKYLVAVHHKILYFLHGVRFAVRLKSLSNIRTGPQGFPQWRFNYDEGGCTRCQII